ncbi:MAG: arginine deiminase family protein [Prolixibacteraceae bacterium]|nr:arginine deiminase family protein [Prolixibacteraceae bacterium]
MPYEAKVQGERWFPSEKKFKEEMKELWGNWYCDSENAKLEAVMMRRPGKEIEMIDSKNFTSFRWKSPMNIERARAQHDKLTEIYRKHGIEVFYVDNQREDRPNALFMRDLVFMTPEGAIVCRPGIAARRGEERYAAEALAKLGVPIVKTINGDGFFDGACAMWVDRETVILGTGSRANKEGATQVEYVLREMDVSTIIPFNIPYGHAHLDGLMNFPDKKTVAVFPWQVPYDVVKPLMDKGFKVVEITNLEEIKAKASLNFVGLEPGKIVMPAGCPDTKNKLEEAGITVVETEVDEIMNGWGAMHCMTVFLRRSPI